ncbi:MAG: glycosyltransferase family 4 protein, partial [Thermoanaerobaculia bacterium]|nr:glycosyltransferase family 4 protein [Thermoanaerobaculia bacterium]
PLRRGGGGYRLLAGDAQRTSPPWVEVRVDAGRTSAEEAIEWLRGQTLEEAHVVAVEPTGSELWRVDGAGPAEGPEEPSRWFLSSEDLPTVHSAWLESAALVAACEGVDAVFLAPGLTDAAAPEVEASDLLRQPLRATTLLARDAFDEEPSPTGRTVRAKNRSWQAKLLPLAPTGPERDLPYRTAGAGANGTISLDDLSLTTRRPPDRDPAREPVLVLTPFLARGGAEHTLFETLLYLRDGFDFTLVTLAPHRPELGDRREDFLAVTSRILCLGDLVHPAAMPGILRSLLASTGTRTVYNANSTTLFYDFAPGLKQFDPGLRILDHLYDHQVGYIERYEDPELLGSVDLCVAENHQIAERLVEEFAWPSDRVPVIWPCGRNPEALPPKDTVGLIRSEVRAELEVSEDSVIFLTAARMHEQKRPLDLVELAKRVTDLEEVLFLVVGGGPLETEVDELIAHHRLGNIRRLPFRTDIPRLIAASDVGCLISEYEGLPVFMMECFQLGRPFLGTDVGDLGRVLRQSGAGLVVDQPGDLDALEAAVRRLATPEERSRLAPLARAAAAPFSVASCSERYAAVFSARTAT